MTAFTLRQNRERGLSGIMRAKNEAQFIGACIDSCIDALDELIVVYNDCTDDTPKILERKRLQYPDKLKIYSYNHDVLGFNLSYEDFKLAISLPEDSPRLFCNQCNFALSKVSYKYAMIIDPDQIYFTDELKRWRDICRAESPIKWNPGLVIGWFLMMYISAYRRVSLKLDKPCLKMLPLWMVGHLKTYYQRYAEWRLQNDKATITVSGINLFWDNEWYVPFDHINRNPPYNGATDHLIFQVSERTYFYRRYDEKIPNEVMESFHNSNKIMFADTPLWFHQHANRHRNWHKVKLVKDQYPERFVHLRRFVDMNYKEVLDKMDSKTTTLFQRTSFALVHMTGIRIVKNYCKLLEKITIC